MDKKEGLAALSVLAALGESMHIGRPERHKEIGRSSSPAAPKRADSKRKRARKAQKRARRKNR